MQRAFVSLVFVVLGLAGLVRGEEDAQPPDDTLWKLLHDEAVLNDLQLTPEQRKAWRVVLDPLDLRLWPLRNQSPPVAQQGLAAILADAQEGTRPILRAAQRERLSGLHFRVLGTRSLLREDLAAALKLTEKQRGELAVLHAAKERSAGLSEEEQKAVVDVLTAGQRVQWNKRLADDFDPKELGKARYKAPALVGEPGDWIGGKMPMAAQLKGRVLVIHFFAFGCINCIHNYPSYRKWQSELDAAKVTLIGIHSPETQAEQDVAALQQKLDAESLTFPVLVDNDKKNWNAWGNHWWPAVYIVDREGYLRAHWPGELKWQGADGEARMEQQIAAILNEGKPSHAQ
jgi:peroxiredoxin